MTNPPYPGQPYPGQPYSGQPYSGEPYGGQPYPGQAPQPSWSPVPTSALQFTVQGSVMTTSFVPPTLTIDGYPTPIASGTTTIPIHPGQHRLEVYSQWMRRYGQAALDLSVPPNSMVQVFYAPPWHQFTTGELGFTPQKRKGIAVLLVPLAVVLLFVLVGFLAILFGS